jgi:hypothetical protein
VYGGTMRCRLRCQRCGDVLQWQNAFTPELYRLPDSCKTHVCSHATTYLKALVGGLTLRAGSVRGRSRATLQGSLVPDADKRSALDRVAPRAVPSTSDTWARTSCALSRRCAASAMPYRINRFFSRCVKRAIGAIPCAISTTPMRWTSGSTTRRSSSTLR